MSDLEVAGKGAFQLARRAADRPCLGRARAPRRTENASEDVSRPQGGEQELQGALEEREKVASEVTNPRKDSLTRPQSVEAKRARRVKYLLGGFAHFNALFSV